MIVVNSLAAVKVKQGIGRDVVYLNENKIKEKGLIHD